MPQLHLYVPDETADVIRRRAEERRMSVSKYLAEIVTQNISDTWPKGFFREVVGAWHGEPLERPPQGEFEAREDL